MSDTLFIEKEKKEITRKIRVILGFKTRKDIGVVLGITQNTLRSRLVNNDWTYEEVLIINKMYSRY